MKAFQYFAIFVSLMCFSQGYEFLQTQCKDQGSFYIVENQSTFVTCLGLDEHHKINWTVTYPNGSEIRIGECPSCTVCGGACTTFTKDYEVARTLSYSTLYFNHNLEDNDGAVVKCSNVDYSIEKTCNINVIKPCRSNHLVLLHRYAPIQCQGLQSSQAMHWETVYPDGRTRSIANCAHCHTRRNCPACRVNDNSFTVTRKPTFSTLKIAGNDDLYNETTLRCSSEDETMSVECKVSLSYYRISQCVNGVLKISETRPTKPISCEGMPNTDSVLWEKDSPASAVHVAQCAGKQNNYACTTDISEVAVTRNDTVSQLVITNYSREDWVNKTLICARNDRNMLDTCRIRVVYPVFLQNRTVRVNDDFTVTAQVDIKKMYDSDFNVKCAWHRLTGTAITLLQTTQPSLSRFTERDGGPEFYHGSCSVTMDVPFQEWHYRVHVEVMPDPGLKKVGDFDITKPGQLRLEAASCPKYVAEGQDIGCRCNHLSTEKGSPPAHVYWQSADNPATLTLTNAKRRDNGIVYRCYSEWGKPTEQRTLEYTVLVAYGPTTTNVTRLSNTTDLQQHESFTCTPDEVYPSANFSWNLPCKAADDTTQSTCTVTQETLRDKTEVVCFVSNSGLPELRSTDTFKLPETNQKKTFPKSNVLETGISVAVVVVVVVAVAAVVIGVTVCVVVVVIRRRRGRKALSTAGKARFIRSPDDQNDEFEEYINECYESADGMQIPRQVDSAKTSFPQAQGSSSKPDQSTSSKPDQSTSSKRDQSTSSKPDQSTSSKPDQSTSSKPDQSTSSKPDQSTSSKPDQSTSSSHGDVYAQVLKKTNVKTRKQVPTKSDQTLAGTSNAASEGASSSALGDVYAQVLKKAHVEHHEMKKAGDASKAQMQSSSRGGIGKLSVDAHMTSSDIHTDGTTVEETDDEYNDLKFTRTGASEADSHYSHLK